MKQKTKKEDISDELEKVLALKRLFKSPGGRLLITILRNNCVKALRKALTAAREGKDVQSFILDYGANIDVLMSLGDLSLEEELREQLDEAIKEAEEA